MEHFRSRPFTFLPPDFKLKVLKKIVSILFFALPIVEHSKTRFRYVWSPNALLQNLRVVELYSLSLTRYLIPQGSYAKADRHLLLLSSPSPCEYGPSTYVWCSGNWSRRSKWSRIPHPSANYCYTYRDGTIAFSSILLVLHFNRCLANNLTALWACTCILGQLTYAEASTTCLHVLLSSPTHYTITYPTPSALQHFPMLFLCITA